MAPKTLNQFGRLMTGRLRELGLSEREFCRAVGIRQNAFHYMKYRTPSAKGAPSKEVVGTWAKALGLDDAASETLYLQVQLLYAPASVQEYVRRLERQANKASR